jgi:hypothetical protein
MRSPNLEGALNVENLLPDAEAYLDLRGISLMAVHVAGFNIMQSNLTSTEYSFHL